MEKSKVVSQLKAKEGNVVVNNLTVRNINTTDMTTWQRVAVTLDKPVTAMVEDKENPGTYVVGSSNIIFVSSFSLVSTLRDNPEAAFAGNSLIENPKAIGVILSGAKIDVILEKVTTGETYKNPWSDNATETLVQHDSYYSHIVNITLSDFGRTMLLELAKHLMFG